MPQCFHVLRCFNCNLFQVIIIKHSGHQVKKIPKWICKVCGEKQSVKKVFGNGTGKECRLFVQELNEKQILNDSITSENFEREYERPNVLRKEDETIINIFKNEDVIAKSKWEEFKSSSEDEDQATNADDASSTFCFQLPQKKRAKNKQGTSNKRKRNENDNGNVNKWETSKIKVMQEDCHENYTQISQNDNYVKSKIKNYKTSDVHQSTLHSLDNKILEEIPCESIIKNKYIKNNELKVTTNDLNNKTINTHSKWNECLDDQIDETGLERCISEKSINNRWDESVEVNVNDINEKEEISDNLRNVEKESNFENNDVPSKKSIFESEDDNFNFEI
ncbi:uncharacterized protein LOC109605853 [Aethina tumida]|uniref:uncharacterized protein LOC109605853 n=1 Tax=Aethina tumida TaxID=116153 RepID=UPI0021499264|nr:uncharacterized protein LOC109605853 [Aethina tumida]